MRRKEIMRVTIHTTPEPFVFERREPFGHIWQGHGVTFECGGTREEIIDACWDAAEDLYRDIPPYTEVSVC